MLYYIHQRKAIGPSGSRANPRMTTEALQREDQMVGINLPTDQLRRLSRFPGVTSAKYNITEENSRSLFDSMKIVENRIRTNKNFKIAPKHFLFPYQVAGIAFVLARKGRAMLIDPMGVGKSLQALGSILAGGPSYLPAVVVSPINAFSSWAKAISDWSTFKPFIVGDGEAALDKSWPAKGSTRLAFLIERLQEGKWPDDWIIVLNYEKLTEELCFLLGDSMSTVIFDEAHRLKSPTALRSQASRILAERIDRVILLTGTPVLNSAAELWSLAELVSSKEELGNSAVWPRTEEQQSILHEKWLKTFIPISGKNSQSRPEITDSSSGFKTFSEYTPELTQELNNFLRSRGVRRSRKMIAETGAMTGFSPQRKIRRYIFVPVDSNSEYAEFLKQNEKRVDTATKTFDKNIIMLRDWFTDLISICFRGANPEQLKTANAKLLAIVRVTDSPIVQQAAEMMGMHALNAAGDIYADAERPVIFFTANHTVAKRLAKELKEDFEDDYIYLAVGSDEINQVGPYSHFKKIDPARRRAKLKRGFAELSEIFAAGNEKKKRMALIATPAGKESLNLPAAETVVFVQRLATPGDEMQAEDRINRPDQKGQPKAIYIIPQEPFATILNSRAERKRESMMAVLGESSEDDYSEPLILPKPQIKAADYMREKAANFDTANRIQQGLVLLNIAEMDPEHAFDIFLKAANDLVATVKEVDSGKVAAASRPTVIEDYSPLPSIAGINTTNILKALTPVMSEYVQLMATRTAKIPVDADWAPFLQLDNKYSKKNSGDTEYRQLINKTLSTIDRTAVLAELSPFVLSRTIQAQATIQNPLDKACIVLIELPFVSSSEENKHTVRFGFAYAFFQGSAQDYTILISNTNKELTTPGAKLSIVPDSAKQRIKIVQITDPITAKKVALGHPTSSSNYKDKNLATDLNARLRSV